MRPCLGEISHEYVASRIHEMGVRKQGEDDTDQIRKVVTANFRVCDWECKFLDTITNKFPPPENKLKCAQNRSLYYSDDLVASGTFSAALAPERFRRDTS